MNPQTAEILSSGAEQQLDADIRSAFAESSVRKIFEWLEIHSPNNANYLNSTAYTLPESWLKEHAQSIESVVADGLSSMDMRYAGVDLRRVETLRNGVVYHINQRTGVREPLAKMYEASGFLNSGIEEATQEIDWETSPEIANEHTIRAIGAMLLRGLYFEQLSAESPDRFTASERDNLLRVFQQNILSCVRKAAMIEDAQRSATTERQLVPLAILPELAAA